MSNKYNWCLGPDCHKKQTQDRIRGVKGNKVLRTRKVPLDSKWRQTTKWGYFCSNRCLDDYEHKYLAQFIAIAPCPEPLETSCEVIERKVEGTSYNWQTRESEPHTYTQKEIIVDNDNR